MKYLKSINEWRNQLEIPFDGDKKPSHINVLDAIQELSLKSKKKYNDIIKDIKPPDEYYDHYKKEAFDEMIDDIENHISEYDVEAIKYEFFDGITWELIDYDRYVEIEQIEKDDLEDGDLEHLILDLKEKGLFTILNNVSEVGKEKLLKIINDVLLENLYDYDFMSNIELNKDGLVKIWRAINIDDKIDEFEEVMKYENIGIFWSWTPDGAIPYGSIKYGKEYILHGLVNPKDINWVETIKKNTYYLREEREIEVNSNSNILIYKTETDKGKIFDTGDKITDMYIVNS